MVGGVSSRTDKRPNYGTRHDQPTSRALKAPKSSNLRCPTNHGPPAVRSSDANTGASLKISNWRVRQSDDSSGGSRSSMMMPMEDDPTSSTSSSTPKFSSFRTCSTRRQSKTGNSVSASSHGSEKPVDVGRYTNPTLSHRSSSASSGGFSFDVVRYSQLLERDDGQIINLFEMRRSSQDSAYSSGGEGRCTLTPASSNDYSADDDLMHMIARKHTVTPEESQREQLLAALCAAEATPGRSASSSFSSYVDALQSFSIHSESTSSIAKSKTISDRSTKTTSTDSELFSPSNIYHDPDSYQKKGLTPEPAVPCAHSSAVANDDQEKFEQIIYKLNLKGRHEHKLAEEGVDGGFKTGTVPKKCPRRHQTESVSIVQHRRPTHGPGRRVNTESDFMIEYAPASGGRSRAEHSTDCGSTVDHDKTNSLNPKAREFLSFSKASSNASTVHRRPMLSSCDFSAKDDTSDLAEPGAACAEADLRDGASYQSPVLPLVGCLPALYPNHFGAHTFLGRCPATNRVPLGLVPITMDTCKSSSIPTAGWPSAPPHEGILQEAKGGHFQPSNPFLPPIPSIPGIPYLPMPRGTGGLPDTAIGPVAPIPPRPVPKPKSPNPKTQQEYEAWVEWRKSNEPGYAMACKLRQQRRAQRRGTQQSKPELCKTSG
ncbi:hypothetical protein C2857_002714 [Epichloe festucae Fl1]|uniref:Uncharacterized protein n=1 Tax=Epichloe festucae (strain Fl1) TaxID=877507 RepID=A0A7S9KUM2_EPIFF|nr:hypothetical protein C2857_002714 [Epichloe festucae Fl1]